MEQRHGGHGRHRPSRLVCLGVAAVLAGGCGGSSPAPGNRLSGAALQTAVSRASVSIYDYCVRRIGGPAPAARNEARRAAAMLRDLYRATPGSPYPDRGRNLPRRALEDAAVQLPACDSALAGTVRSYLAASP